MNHWKVTSRGPTGYWLALVVVLLAPALGLAADIPAAPERPPGLVEEATGQKVLHLEEAVRIALENQIGRAHV